MDNRTTLDRTNSSLGTKIASIAGYVGMGRKGGHELAGPCRQHPGHVEELRDGLEFFYMRLRRDQTT